MKNKSLFLSVALTACLLMLVSTSSAQFTEVWKVSPGTWPAYATGDNIRGAALNRSNNHYLVARRDIPRIYVYDAVNGTLLDSLNMTGITGGAVVIQDIEATSDGVVYATNLITNGLTDTFKIYRWANDNSATVPTVAFSGLVKEATRVGDAFDVAGTGTGTVIYAGGNNSAMDSVQVFTTVDGVTFTNSGTIRITGNDAGMGISQITPGGDFLTSRYTTGSPIRLYSGTGAGRLDAVPTSVTPAFQADIAYLEAAGRKWIASVESLATAGHNHKGVLLNATYGLSGAVKVGVTPTIGTAANTASIGADVELQYNAADSTMTMFLMVDNNGFAAYKSGNLLTSNLAPFGGNIVRSQFVPLNGINDTVFVDVQDDEYIPKDSVKLYYSVDGAANVVGNMTLASGDSVKGKYFGVIPGAVNTNGKRISYFVTASDNKGSLFTSATSGYFAGITKMTLAGPRAIDTATGVILWNGYGIRVQGVCTQEDSLIAIPTSRHDVVLQDETGAMDFIEFAVSSVAPPWRMKRGRLYTAAGLIGQFRGKIQVAIPATGKNIEVTDNGPGVLFAPIPVKVGDLTFSKLGELHENALIKIANVRLTASSLPWPGAGASGTNLTITDNGIDSLTLRVPALSNANGVPPASQPFTVVGIAGQFTAATTAPFKDGYQIIMRMKDDVIPEIMVAMKDTTKEFVSTEVVLPVSVGNVTGAGITSFQFTAQYDSTALEFVNVSTVGTLSNGYTVASNVVRKGLVEVAASGTVTLKDSGAIVNYRFKILKVGSSTITLNGQLNEGNPLAMVKGGVVVGYVLRQIVETKNSKMRVGITNVGHIGALDAYQDNVGFVYNAADRLYEGSLIMGNAKNRVPNAARFSDAPSWNPGFRHRTPIMVTNVGSKIETSTSFDDSTYSSPLGILVNQRTAIDTAAGKDGYLILRYNVINKSSSAISNFRLGSFFDFDLTSAGDADRGGILKDSTNTITGVNGGAPFKIHLAYIYNGTTYTGVVPLSQTVFAGGRIAIGPDEVYSGKMVDSNKYTYISTFRTLNTYTDAGTPNDLSIFSSVGPYTMAANDTAKGSFALVVGSSLTELLANARLAQKAGVQEHGITLQILTGVNDQPDQLPIAFAIEQNYPNPFNPSTTIRFALPSNSPVRMSVYDILGREVRTLMNTDLNAGYHQVVWDGRNNFGTSVSSGVYIYRIEAGTFISTKKMMLMK